MKFPCERCDNEHEIESSIKTALLIQSWRTNIGAFTLHQTKSSCWRRGSRPTTGYSYHVRIDANKVDPWDLAIVPGSNGMYHSIRLMLRLLPGIKTAPQRLKFKVVHIWYEASLLWIGSFTHVVTALSYCSCSTTQ